MSSFNQAPEEQNCGNVWVSVLKVHIVEATAHIRSLLNEQSKNSEKRKRVTQEVCRSLTFKALFITLNVCVCAIYNMGSLCKYS